MKTQRALESGLLTLRVVAGPWTSCPQPSPTSIPWEGKMSLSQTPLQPSGQPSDPVLAHETKGEICWGSPGQAFIFPMKKDRCGWICHPLLCCSCSDNRPHVYGCGGCHETMKGQTNSNNGGAKRKKLKSLVTSQKCKTCLGMPTSGFLLSEEKKPLLTKLLQS